MDGRDSGPGGVVAMGREACGGLVGMGDINVDFEVDLVGGAVGRQVQLEVDVDGLEGHQPAGRREPNGGHPPRNNVTDSDLTFTDAVVHGGQLAADDEDGAPPRREGEKLP